MSKVIIVFVFMTAILDRSETSILNCDSLVCISEKDAVESTIKSFLIWYKANYFKISSIELIPQMRDGDPSNVYRVSEANVIKFVNVLRTSGYVSEAYLGDLKKYISGCASKIEKQNLIDGPSGCLDFDLILLTLELDEAFLRIDKVEVTDIEINDSGKEASAIVNLFYKLHFTLCRTGNKWTIDKIKLSP